MTADENFKKLNEVLPDIPKPKAIYKPCLVDGKYLYVSGHVPLNPDGSRVRGKVGLDLDTEEAKKVARLVGLCILSSIKNQFGSGLVTKASTIRNKPSTE